MKHTRHLKGTYYADHEFPFPNFHIVEFKIVSHVSNEQMACDLCESKCKSYLKFKASNGGGVVISISILLCEPCVKEVMGLF